MSGTIFDLIEPEVRDGKEGFFDLSSIPEEKRKTFLQKSGDFGKTLTKGIVEGLYGFGRAFGPLPSEQTSEQFSQGLNELLPSEENFASSSLRRGLAQAPTALGTPFSAISTLPRAMIAGFLGEGAEELGLPEWAQSAAELTAYLSPDVTKKLLISGKNADIIEAGKKFGMTDQQITPLIQSEFKQKWLSKLSPKRGSTEKALKNTKGKLGEVYSEMKGSEIATKALPQSDIPTLQNKISDALFELPSEVRSKIAQDTTDLFSKPITGNSLMNYWSDINSTKIPQIAAALKPSIKEAITSVSPELGKDFEMINKLYTKYYPIASKLKPNLASDIVGSAETLGILGSLVTGNLHFLYGFAGEKAVRKLAQQMLINPRLQQLSKKTIDALNQNNPILVKKVSDLIAKNISKTSPEISKELEKLTIEDIKELIGK